MTARRHRHYRRALELLEAVDYSWMPPPGREILEELAEAMLLSRESDPEAVRELRREVEVSVGELSVIGALPKHTTAELTQVLMSAGPPIPSEDASLAGRRAA